MEERLRKRVRGLGDLLVAYSGGVDSALVLAIAYEELGQRAMGVTADSPAMPRAELAAAARIARSIGVRHIVLPTREIDDPDYVANPPNRCYFCKSELYRRLAEAARSAGIEHVANGTNVDDLGDYRPGLQAAHEFRVESPLRDAGLGKADVRALAHKIGLEVWDKPASPCMASRIPYGRPVTRRKLTMIEAAEEHLRGQGLRELRVRHFGATARIEVPPANVARLRDRIESVQRRFREIGFQHVELAEFRSGALNELLEITR